MACGDPNQPVALEYRTKSAEFTTVELDAPTQWWPIADNILTLPDMMQAQEQQGAVTQFTVTLTATSATTYAQDMWFFLYTTTAPAAPTEGAVYNEVSAPRIALVKVLAADWNRLSSTQIQACVAPVGPVNGRHFVTQTGSTATEIYVVGVFAQASPVQLANPTTIACEVTTRLDKV